MNVQQSERRAATAIATAFAVVLIAIMLGFGSSVRMGRGYEGVGYGLDYDGQACLNLSTDETKVRSLTPNRSRSAALRRRSDAGQVQNAEP